MKRFILILLFLFLLTGCTAPMQPPTTIPPTQPASAPPASSAPAATPAPEITEPEPEGPQPMELVGTWDRIWTEIEGDRNPSKSGSCTLTIVADSEQNLTVSYTDKDYPRFNFQNRSLTISAQALYHDCSNDRWSAQVSQQGSMSYSMTLLEDGTLLMLTEFSVDGMPMVSSEAFQRK